MCEEVQHPATQVPKAMVGTIILNTFAGLLFLLPLLFVMPDLTELINLASGQPVPAIIKAAVGNDVGAFILTIPLFILALICGIGCTTATSRCTWAFARDGAIPGAKWWKTVNHKMDVPFNAMMLSMVVQIILGVIYFGSTAAFNAFSGVGVICLTASYAVPIAVSLAGGRTHIAEGSFHLGKLGVFCNIVSLCTLEIPPSVPPCADKIHRLVAARHPAVLHAHHDPRCCRNDELCVGCVLRLRHAVSGLVRRLGPPQLPGPPYRRLSVQNDAPPRNNNPCNNISECDYFYHLMRQIPIATTFSDCDSTKRDKHPLPECANSRRVACIDGSGVMELAKQSINSYRQIPPHANKKVQNYFFFKKSPAPLFGFRDKRSTGHKWVGCDQLQLFW